MPVDVRYGSGTDICRPGFYVRYTPNNRHRSWHVRFRGKSGHSGQVRQCPLLAKTGHSAKANIQLSAGLLLSQIGTLGCRWRGAIHRIKSGRWCDRYALGNVDTAITLLRPIICKMQVHKQAD